MLLSIQEIRNARCAAICALLVACVLISGASAQQAASADTTKPATQTPSTTKSSSPSSAAKSSSATHPASSAHHPRKKKSRVRGQQKIDPERARTIQEALIREHYLTGGASGTWNQASEDAMRRYQGDHGWQTKEVPDSRALISLGLGPSKDHLLNPESAMTTGPQTPASSAPAANPAAPATPSPAAPSPVSNSGDHPGPR
jgi:hypothetical protein